MFSKKTRSERRRRKFLRSWTTVDGKKVALVQTLYFGQFLELDQIFFLENKVTSQVFFGEISPRSDHPKPAIQNLVQNGYPEKWPFCAIWHKFVSGGRQIALQGPKFFLQSQVTQNTFFAKKCFFSAATPWAPILE